MAKAKVAVKKPGKALVPSTKMSYDNSVAKRGKGAVTHDEEEYTGGANPMSVLTRAPKITAEDIAMPTLRWAQGQSTEVQERRAKVGDLVLTGEEPVQSAIVVPLVYGKGRQRWSPNQDDRRLLCESTDTVTGRGNPGGSCADCSCRLWPDKQPVQLKGRKAAKGGAKVRSGPECDMYYKYLAWSDTHQQMLFLDFRRTGIKTAQNLNLMIMQKGLGKFAIKITTVSGVNPTGQSYTKPVVQFINVKADVLKKANAMAAEYDTN